MDQAFLGFVWSKQLPCWKRGGPLRWTPHAATPANYGIDFQRSFSPDLVVSGRLNLAVGRAGLAPGPQAHGTLIILHAVLCIHMACIAILISGACNGIGSTGLRSARHGCPVASAPASIVSCVSECPGLRCWSMLRCGSCLAHLASLGQNRRSHSHRQAIAGPLRASLGRTV